MTEALKFERRTCGRCGGSGSYSWNAIDGSRCYGCGGSGEKLTKRSAVVNAALVKLQEQPADSARIGDVIRATGITIGGGTYRTTAIIAGPLTFEGHVARWRRGDETGEYEQRHFPTLMGKKREPSQHGIAPDSKFQFILKREARIDALRLAIEWQNALTMQGKSRKDSIELIEKNRQRIATIYSDPDNRINEPID